MVFRYASDFELLAVFDIADVVQVSTAIMPILN